ncbi:uncharacterized protein EV154DRAFT_487418 [Mucor mucedo]|uniref:uncharacterized protein n=1 Tax=Mucor mucedo TaxID=29922 RepID=UPI002220DC3B|nr:uncharacterized protein EV154DRAFT_487418 [Mucor mucedo]KAI7873161.1 hypothetical protein EV154DRAFT_487418 [Mucor mucedo]
MPCCLFFFFWGDSKRRVAVVSFGGRFFFSRLSCSFGYEQYLYKSTCCLMGLSPFFKLSTKMNAICGKMKTLALLPWVMYLVSCASITPDQTVRSPSVCVEKMMEMTM